MTILAPDSPSDAILAAAADLLRRHGMYNGPDHLGRDFWTKAADQPWNPNLALDPLAAIAVAMGGRTCREVLALLGDCDNLHPAVRAVFDHLGLSGRLDDQVSAWFAWCDRQWCRDVVRLYERVAADLRTRAGVPA